VLPKEEVKGENMVSLSQNLLFLAEVHQSLQKMPVGVY